MKLFTPNIDNKGRLVRGLIAVILLVAAALSYDTSRWLAATLALSGLFVAFEAIRGWCGLRACGIKTRL